MGKIRVLCKFIKRFFLENTWRAALYCKCTEKTEKGGKCAVSPSFAGFGGKRMSKKKIFTALALAAAFLITGCGGGGENGGTTPKGPNMADFPLYDENYATLTYSAEDYAQKISQPYWLGNVVYNEIALPVLYDSGDCYVNLLYAPKKVIAVHDRSLTVTYEEGTDYTVDAANKRLIVPQGSAIPTWRDGIELGQNVPSEFHRVDDWTQLGWENDYLVWDPAGKGTPSVYAESPVFYGKYLSVTYAYDIADLPKDVYPVHDGWKLTGIRNKLKNGENIKLATLGDSITEGCSSTEKISQVLGRTVLPGTPYYVHQVKNEIERVYGVDVTLVNAGVGGSHSGDLFGSKVAAKYAQAKALQPDLCVIAYGTNDVGVNDELEFAENIERAMNEMRAVSPACEFILVHAFPCNPLTKNNLGMYDKYLNKLNAIAAKFSDDSVAVADMHKVGEHMLQTKKYCEISSSNVNHPNDFMHRAYAAGIMTAICDYKK